MCNDDTLDTVCRMELLNEFAEKYVLFCRENKSGKKERFPNAAGFCRFCGFTGAAIDRIKNDYPEYWSALCLVFEDEALNSDVPASVLTAYLKKRLGYGEDGGSPSSVDTGQLKLVFEHDILNDGS